MDQTVGRGIQKTISKERHVLIILPHPDDETFFVGGTALKYRQMGTPVTYACMTLGEMGRNLGHPPLANRETLPHLRQSELEEACRIMNINDIRFLGYHDKMLEFEDEQEMVDRLEALIRDVNPSLIITFYPPYAIHPDHNVCGKAVIAAVQRLPEGERPTVHAMAQSKDRPEQLRMPDIKIDVSEFLDEKLEAIKAHQTQSLEVEAITEQKLNEGDSDKLEWIRYEQFWIYPV